MASVEQLEAEHAEKDAQLEQIKKSLQDLQ